MTPTETQEMQSFGHTKTSDAFNGGSPDDSYSKPDQGVALNFNKPHKRTDRPLTPLTAAFNFVVLMVGTSMAATPAAFSQTTPIMGVLLEIFLGILFWFAAVCTFNAASCLESTSYIDTGKKAFKNMKYGNAFSHVVISFPLLILLIGALGAYIIMAAQSFEFYLGMDENLTRGILTVVIVVLGTIKSFDNTKFISYPAFFTFLVIVVFILVTTFQFYGVIDHQELKPFNFSQFAQGVPILALGLNGHMGLPGMSAEMKQERHKEVTWYLFAGQMIVVAFNCTVGYFPAVMFGSDVQGNVMEQLNETYEQYYGTISPILLAGNIMLSIVIIIQAPLLVLPLKEIFLDTNGYTVRERSYLVNAIASFVICVLAGCIAIFIPDLNNALNTIATLGSLIITGPAAGALSLMSEKTTFAKWRAWLISIFGCIFFVANIYTIYMQYWG